MMTSRNHHVHKVSWSITPKEALKYVLSKAKTILICTCDKYSYSHTRIKGCDNTSFQIERLIIPNLSYEFDFNKKCKHHRLGNGTCEECNALIIPENDVFTIKQS